MSSDSIQTRAGDILRRLREQKPLVHQITNFVVMNDTANTHRRKWRKWSA